MAEAREVAAVRGSGPSRSTSDEPDRKLALIMALGDAQDLLENLLAIVDRASRITAAVAEPTREGLAHD